jgi:hypothetical protein
MAAASVSVFAAAPVISQHAAAAPPDAGLAGPAAQTAVPSQGANEKPEPGAAHPATPAPPAGGGLDVRRRSAGVMLAGVGTTLAYGRAKWWSDGFSGGFKTVKEGGFGLGTDAGGADKLGHAMFAYAGTRLATRAFEWAGNDRDRALGLGLATAVGTLMAVEVIDGFSARWRFSREDAVANLAGGALGWWLERNPAADALLDVRIQYSPSSGPGGRRDFDPFGDYSGQRYLVVLKATGVPALQQHPWARYVEVHVGYGTRNFEAESRLLVAPTRHLFYGVSLNLTEVLRGTAFRGHASLSRAQHLTETFLEYVQVPATTLQGDRVIR